MPALSLLLSWLEWVGKYHKTEPGAREANGCIPPSTSTSTACLHSSVFNTIPASSFFLSQSAMQILSSELHFFFLISLTFLHTAVIFHFCLHYACLQLYTVSQITIPLSSTLTYTVKALWYMTETFILQLCSLLYRRDLFFVGFFFGMLKQEKKNQIESTSCGFGICRYNRLFEIEGCSHLHRPYYGADCGELHSKENK